MSKKCDFCGHFNTDEAKVCKTCGISLDQKEEKVRDVLFIDKYAIPLSIIFIFIIPALMFILIGSYDFFQAKYLIISCLFIFLGFVFIIRSINRDPYSRLYRILLIIASAYTIFIIPLVYFLTSLEIVG